MDLEVVPLTAATWGVLEAFFREGGDPRWCWCQWWRMRSRDFGAAKVLELRERLRAQASAATVEGIAPGLVALDGERAVGWISLGPREDFERLERSRVIPRLDARPVWAIVCFAVASDRRGRGIAARLLAAAVEYARLHGARLLEGYPIDAPTGTPVVPGAAYTGTRALFEAAGFTQAGTTGSASGGIPRVVVRLELDAPPG